LPQRQPSRAVRDGRAWIGLVPGQQLLAQQVGEKGGCLDEIPDGKTEMVDALGGQFLFPEVFPVKSTGKSDRRMRQAKRPVASCGSVRPENEVENPIVIPAIFGRKAALRP